MNEDAMVRVTDQSGKALAARGLAICEDAYGNPDYVELTNKGKGVLTTPADVLHGASRVLIIPQVPGYWVMEHTPGDACVTIACESLDPEDAPSWWHELLGRYADDPDRGSGVRIGVIDSSFTHRGGLETVEDVALADGSGKTKIAAGAMWRHGEAVCRILADRSAPLACAPIAPGASVSFVSASFTEATQRHPSFRMPVAGGSDDLDPERVRAGMFTLILEHRVDLINLSLGSFVEMPWESALEEAITLAREEGVLVICAAGNLPGDAAAFPARLKTCIGVGAYGVTGWGPVGSLANALSEDAAEIGEEGEVRGLDIFYSTESAYGDGIDTIAPGVALLIARDGRPAFDITGTSFAAPIATGLLAVALAADATYLAMPRDAQRARYAEQRLLSLCIPSGIDEDWEGYGPVQL